MFSEKGLNYINLINPPVLPTRANVENHLFLHNPYIDSSFYQDDKYVPTIDFGALTTKEEGGGLFSHFQQPRTQNTNVILAPYAKPPSNSSSYNKQVFSRHYFQKTKAKPKGETSRKANLMPMKPPLHPRTTSLRSTTSIMQSDSLRRQAIMNSFKANLSAFLKYQSTIISNEENNIWDDKRTREM